MSLLAVALLAAGRPPDPACGAASAAQEQTAQASELPAAKLYELMRELEQLAEQYHIPGMSAAVVHRGALAWSQGFGYADLDQETWAMPETRYQTASVAKPMAAVLILQLVEQGKLSLDAPMKDFLIHKWFAPDPVRYHEQPVLLRHVLTHTSEGVPGDAYAYNGNTYFDLTWVVEDVTRTAYPRLLQERIFERAGMDRSVPGYALPGTAELVELARPYEWERDSYLPTRYQMIDPDPALDLEGFDVVLRMPEKAIAARKELLGEGFMHLNGANTAAEVTTTVLDLAKFDIALDEGRLLSAESRERMWTPAVSNGGETLPYAPRLVRGGIRGPQGDLALRLAAALRVGAVRQGAGGAALLLPARLQRWPEPAVRLVGRRRARLALRAGVPGEVRAAGGLRACRHRRASTNTSLHHPPRCDRS